MPSDKPMIGVRLEPSEKRSVENAAKRDGRSVCSYVRMLLIEKLGLAKPEKRKP